MKYKAVIFDLFGTLVETSTIDEYKKILAEMADVLRAPRDEFTRLWFQTFNQRVTGELPSPERNIRYVCDKLGVRVTDEQVKEASRIRRDYTRSCNIPRPDALDTMALLKEKGLKIGLISDCAGEVPICWEDTPLAPMIDTPMFSCSVGIKKPDARIYLMAASQLGVNPKDCLYVGDGSSHELTGAQKVGMHPVLIRVPHEDGTQVYRVDEEEWHGPRISSLSEVLGMLEKS